MQVHITTTRDQQTQCLIPQLPIKSYSILFTRNIEYSTLSNYIKTSTKSINTIRQYQTSLSQQIPQISPFSITQLILFTMQPLKQPQVGRPSHIILPEQDQDISEMPLYGKCQYCCGQCGGVFRTWAPCIFCCCFNYPYNIVEQGNEGIFIRFGKYVKTVEPGLHYVNPCTDVLQSIDIKINVMDLNRQQIITKDNVSISIDASVYYQVINSRFAYYRVQNFQRAISEVTYAILKNTCGQFVLQDILEKRQEIADDIEKQVDQYTEEWGIDIDIQLNKQLQESLSSAAKERRLAESKIISAKADVESAKLMRKAADLLNSKAAMQMRYLDTLKMLGNSSNSKVIFIPEMKAKEKLQHMITQGIIS